MSVENKPPIKPYLRKRMLVFSIFGELYALDVPEVNKVISMTAMQIMPEMPDYFEGVIDYHGTIFSVINLMEYLNIKGDAKYHINTPIVLCERENCHLGLIVEEILGISVVLSQTAQTEETASEVVVNDLFKGVVNTRFGKALLLNLHRAFQDCQFINSVQG